VLANDRAPNEIVRAAATTTAATWTNRLSLFARIRNSSIARHPVERRTFKSRARFPAPATFEHGNSLRAIALLILRRVFPHSRADRTALAECVHFVSY